MSGVESPPDPRLGITNACMTARCEPASLFTVSIVAAACLIGSGLLTSGDVGTHERTVADVAESRNSSFR